jgi:cyanate lyase
MDKDEMTQTILDAKAEKGMTWEAIARAVGMSPVYVTSACLGQSSMAADKAEALCRALDLAPDVAVALQACPYKGSDWTIPTDPLLYRFYEVIQVYGDTIKALIHEKFGDGIMSAIDFTMEVDKQADPKGDRVVVTLNGKFLPYKRW